MRNPLLPLLLAAATGLVGCASHNEPPQRAAAATFAPPVRSGQEYTSSYIHTVRGGAALRDSGYQQVYASASKLRVSPRAEVQAIPDIPSDAEIEAAIYGVSTSVIPGSIDSAIANSHALPSLDSLAPKPAATQTAQAKATAVAKPAPKPAPAKRITVAAKPATKKQAPKAKPQINCNPPTDAQPYGNEK